VGWAFWKLIQAAGLMRLLRDESNRVQVVVGGGNISMSEEKRSMSEEGMTTL
jgi:uridylate kinase